MSEVWPLERAPELSSANGHVESRSAPGTYPIPSGRGRWRVTLHARQYAANISWQSSIIAELGDARGRRLDQTWDSAAVFTFVIDGHSMAAALIKELTQDVIVWRWDDQVGYDRAMFRGVIAQSEDQLSEQSHTVTFTCHDYLAMLTRRLVTSTLTYVGTDQDNIASALLTQATQTQTSGGVALSPGAFLPISLILCNPDGTNRGGSGQLRDRTYLASTVVGTALDELAKVISGFDYDVAPFTAISGDNLRIFYPYQGIARSTPALVYGSTVANLTRTVASGDYANYWRVLGNNASSDPATPQLYSEARNSDASSGTAGAVGLWMSDVNAADVTIQSTLDQQAQGNLLLSGVLIPSYALTLTPDAYSWGNPNMGDVVPLIIQSGRLNVNTTVRVLGISYMIGDDGQEDVALTVGRPAVNFLKLFSAADRDINALTRR
jgi:hypothetical protein